MSNGGSPEAGAERPRAAGDSEDLASGLATWVRLFDEVLIHHYPHPSDRILPNALRILTDVVKEVHDPKDPVDLSDPAAATKSRVFRWIHKTVRDWYVETYGDSLKKKRSTLLGFVLFRGQPVRFEAPTSLVEATDRGTFLLRIPDHIMKAENPMQWVINGPRLEAIEVDERKQLQTSVRTVARLLRQIRSAKMGITQPDEILKGLLRSTSAHVRQATQKTADDSPDLALSAGWWDLHFASECALKALLYHRTGRYPEGHDLTPLANQARDFAPTLDPRWLSSLPGARAAIDGRYGTTRESWKSFFTAYLSTLRIVNASFQPLPSLRFGRGWVEFQRPPWFQDLATPAPTKT